jgi:CubicO group peptidase (beta-lactamase class C family)
LYIHNNTRNKHSCKNTREETEEMAEIKAILDNALPSVPGLVYRAINAHGDTLVDHAAGSRGLVANSSPMTPDTVFWLASCTKMITGIACMQLVEQGKLSLDDVPLVERIAPELQAVKVLDGDVHAGFRLVEKKRGITLRMLLSHTGVPSLFTSRATVV